MYTLEDVTVKIEKRERFDGKNYYRYSVVIISYPNGEMYTTQYWYEVPDSPHHKAAEWQHHLNRREQWEPKGFYGAKTKKKGRQTAVP
jgi:hypothetical protein